MAEVLFTGASLIDFLSQVEELKDQNLDLKETDLGFQVTIGDSIYNILPFEPTTVEVEEEVLDTVADANLDALLDMEAEGKVTLREFRDDEAVEGGPILNLIKTLFVGGLVRMGTKQLGKDAAKALLNEAKRSRR